MNFLSRWIFCPCSLIQVRPVPSHAPSRLRDAAATLNLARVWLCFSVRYDGFSAGFFSLQRVRAKCAASPLQASRTTRTGDDRGLLRPTRHLARLPRVLRVDHQPEERVRTQRIRLQHAGSRLATPRIPGAEHGMHVHGTNARACMCNLCRNSQLGCSWHRSAHRSRRVTSGLATPCMCLHAANPMSCICGCVACFSDRNPCLRGFE